MHVRKILLIFIDAATPKHNNQARIQAGAHPARAPPKIGKNMNFYSEINKKCQKSIKKAKNFRASLRSANI